MLSKKFTKMVWRKIWEWEWFGEISIVQCESSKTRSFFTENSRFFPSNQCFTKEATTVDFAENFWMCVFLISICNEKSTSIILEVQSSKKSHFGSSAAAIWVRLLLILRSLKVRQKWLWRGHFWAIFFCEILAPNSRLARA